MRYLLQAVCDRTIICNPGVLKSKFHPSKANTWPKRLIYLRVDACLVAVERESPIVLIRAIMGRTKTKQALTKYLVDGTDVKSSPPPFPCLKEQRKAIEIGGSIRAYISSNSSELELQVLRSCLSEHSWTCTEYFDNRPIYVNSRDAHNCVIPIVSRSAARYSTQLYAGVDPEIWDPEPLCCGLGFCGFRLGR